MKQRGFSLIELIIVVVILSLLAVTALPRFLNITEQAEDAAVEGVAGGFAAAVGLVRAEWEIEGRPSTDDAYVTMTSTRVQVNAFGFPTAQSNNSGPNLIPSAMTGEACKIVFDRVMQSPVRSVVDGQDASNVRYYISVQTNAGVTDSNTPYNLCLYHLVATLNIDKVTGIPAANTINDGNNFTYNSATGQVQVFSNNQ